MPQWTNWSGSVAASPRWVEQPDSESAIQDMVRRAGSAAAAVRVVGTGHSFTPLAATDGLLLSLDRWSGLEQVDAGAQTATVRAGTKLHALGDLLFDAGMAMPNLGDVDVQSIAGAVSTGTHGTGRSLGNVATQVIGLRLVTASGEVVAWDEPHHPDHLHAARVSLGMLGVFSTLTLQLVPAYRLLEQVWQEPVAETQDRLAARIAENVRYEFFWFPESDTTECKTLNPTDLPAEPSAADLVMGTPAGPLAAVRSPATRRRTGWSARVIPSIRSRLFNEMEYAVPAERGPACFAAVRDRMRRYHPDVRWPVEYRTLAADDSWLSPAYARETVTISIHQDARLPYADFFADIERIFVEAEGRPHWGKVHTRTAADLEMLYPRWHDFLRLHADLDPAGRFLNPHLRSVFGIG